MPQVIVWCPFSELDLRYEAVASGVELFRIILLPR
jgi:hypothetical protein